jgi:tetratricopeptide (TPR) repeat protein
MLSTERGAALLARGDAQGAAQAWREVLAKDPVHPGAFVSLAGLALAARDMGLAESLIDSALAAPRVHPDVLRHAVKLVMAAEGEGLAREARVARLCRKLLEISPQDVWAALALARAQLALGETAAARQGLALIERSAPGSMPASEAQAMALAIDDPGLARALENLVKAAHTAPLEKLEEVGARARKVATLHHAWPGWVAAAVADRRRSRWTAARGALEVALELAPGASSAHLELVTVLGELGDKAGSREHAERAVALEGETPRALLALARALAAEGRRKEAQATAARVLAMEPQSEEAKAVLAGPRAKPEKAGWLSAMRGWWKKQ